MSLRRNRRTHMIKGALITTPLLVVALVMASTASAAYEQVATFAEHGTEGFQALPLARSTAVNIAGNGGVTPGTVYVSNSCEVGCGDVGHTNIMTFTDNGEFIAKLPINHNSFAIAIDQATGNLFVLQSANAGKDAIHEYSPMEPRTWRTSVKRVNSAKKPPRALKRFTLTERPEVHSR